MTATLVNERRYRVLRDRAQGTMLDAGDIVQCIHSTYQHFRKVEANGTLDTVTVWLTPADVEDWHTPIPTDHSFENGQKFGLMPNPTTHDGGGVYFDATVTEVEVIEITRWGYGPLGEDVRVRRLNGSGPDTQSVGRRFLYHLPEAFIPDTYTAAEYEALQRSVTDKDAEIARLRRWQESALNDATVISEALNSEAESRDWCSEYDEIVDRINGRTSVLALADREKEVEIEWTEEYTVTVTRTATINVTGDADDAATDYVNDVETLEERELIDLLRENGNHEYQSSDNIRVIN